MNLKCRTNLLSNVEVVTLMTFCTNFQVVAHFASQSAPMKLLLIFVLRAFSWNHEYIYFVCSSLSSLEIFRSICGTLCCEGVLLDIGRNLWQCLVLQSQISSKFPLTKKYVFCVKLISLKNFTLSLNEALKAHYLCFLLLIQRSAVQQKSN